ncbi:PREDICTED: synaptotagmin-17-like, partial [Priapulus caudatus]|uniref:Synaptotagmin-17-like n=1 Tax=Priapulus caudatus TaxID=37621 RepID=A0ABM1F7M0_PRICU
AYVKLSLVHDEKVVKTKRTSVQRATIDPVFNETLNFNVMPPALPDVSLVVSIADRTSDALIGRIVLGKHATGPPEMTHWGRMLHSYRTSVAQWHSLRTKDECDRLSAASLAVSRP